MNLDSVRSLKQELLQQIVTPNFQRLLSIGAYPIRSADHRIPQRPGFVALGIARGVGERDYRLAVRLQSTGLAERIADIIGGRASGEIDRRYIGSVHKLSSTIQLERTAEQAQTRPLEIGVSVSHYLVTAGTIGCFVQDSASQKMLLSNNHVLANENDAATGDAIMQPGVADGGTAADKVATLSNFVPLQFGGEINHVDAAVAALDAGIDVTDDIPGIGALTPASGQPVQPGASVMKRGRTTGVTSGTVTAIELSQISVSYAGGAATFDQVIEIDNVVAAFSAPGDSGSLIVDSGRVAQALLFSGSDTGGSTGLGLTYCNPIQSVLSALNVVIV